MISILIIILIAIGSIYIFLFSSGQEYVLQFPINFGLHVTTNYYASSVPRLNDKIDFTLEIFALKDYHDVVIAIESSRGINIFDEDNEDAFLSRNIGDLNENETFSITFPIKVIEEGQNQIRIIIDGNCKYDDSPFKEIEIIYVFSSESDGYFLNRPPQKTQTFNSSEPMELVKIDDHSSKPGGVVELK